jgi:CRP/FNR family transcriptional regulator, cyclic AMP receptor protein
MSHDAPPASLESVPMFEELTREQLALVEERVRERSVPAGNEVIAQGQPGDALFVVTEGCVKVSRGQPDGGEVILAVLGPGEVVGETSAANGVRHQSSVTTIEDTRLLSLDAETFRGMLDEMPRLRSGLVTLLSRRLRLAESRLEALAALDAEGRVARVLLDLAEQHGEPKPDGGTRISIPLTQGDVAAMTGASRVRVNQIISKFRRNGWVTLDGRRRTSVRDAAALEARCR